MYANKSSLVHALWLIALLVISYAPTASAASAGAPTKGPAKSESIDELYEKAKKEGGKLTLYVALAKRAEEVLLPAFEKRFPGIKINHIDATSDKLVARPVAGQKVYALAGETPAHPKVEPMEKTRPATIYMLSVDDVKEFPKYERLWKEIFKLR